jgi:DNA primase
MPGVDFERSRARVTMEQVLDLLGFEPTSRSGSPWYGSCPLHDSAAGRRHRSFSVNVASGRYYCHRCQSRGNPLELWAAATQQSVYQAAIDLCRRLGCDIPWIRRW